MGMKSTRNLAWILLAMVILPFSSPALVVWDGGAADDDWNSGANWDTNSPPTSSDIARVDAGGVTIEVNAAADALYFSNNDGSGSLVTLNLNPGGSLTESGNFLTGRFAAGSNTVINVAGGELLGGSDIYGPDAGNSGSVTYNISAGLVANYTRFRYANTTVNLSGGMLDMGGASAVPASLSFVNGAALNMSGTGTFVFDIFDNGSNDTLLGGAEVDMTGGVIGFRFADSYTPQVGDSYDFLGVNMLVDGTGSNISSTDIDGKYNITWDTSQWGAGNTGSDPSKGVLTINAISVIPEPSSFALVTLTAGLLTLRRRRRE